MTLKNRVSAFILDMLLVSVLTVLMSNVEAVNPFLEKYSVASSNYEIVYKEELSKLNNNKTDSVSAMKEIMKYQKKMEKYNIFFCMWYLIFYLAYNVLFQYFNDGQTIGKKIFKVKVVNKDGSKATFMNILMRTLFNGSSLLFGITIMVIIRNLLLLIPNDDLYLVFFVLTSLISYIYEIFMIVFLFIKKGKRTLNDMIGKTQIIDV